MYPRSNKSKLIECSSVAGDRCRPQRELIVVEGESASLAVARVRDESFQAVLAMQGKPMNAEKSSEQRVRNHVWFSSLVEAVGLGWKPVSTDRLRYDRISLLFDPDADGIHCGALMLLFFDRYLRILLDEHRVSLIKSPMFEVRAVGYEDRLHAFNEEHLHLIRNELTGRGIESSHTRYRGLASLADATLREHCVAPDTRTAYLVLDKDVAAARSIFGRTA